ncbi:hypothetical protein CBR_g2943 [Chara braunii]|uniref:Cytochrome P450 n=1 Tax=Chara braunii TaxID=69332 RepID=A0A388KEC2_CHABU|nr:hypothetical protein CBR_g2943 [Chara braunii]|eukprot:GBG68399.1 hypothetical protein CBR_g2943 [Chara braunii]
MAAENVWMRMMAQSTWLSVDDPEAHLPLFLLGSLIGTVLVCLFTARTLSWLGARRWSRFGKPKEEEEAKAGRKRKLRLPPGPAPWPIMGNLFQLQRHPHRGLAKMAEKYGGVMTVQLGSVRTLVVSSPAAVKEILVDQGATFASRPLTATIDALTCGGRDLIFAPYGALWRKQRKMASVQMFSPKRMAQVDGIQRKFFACLEEELLRKGGGSGGADKQGGGDMGGKEEGNDSPGRTEERTNTSSSSSFSFSFSNHASEAKVGGGRDKMEAITDGRRGTDGIGSCQPDDGNVRDRSAGTTTVEGLEPVDLREKMFCFILDTLTYVIFGSPVTPGMRRRVARSQLAVDCGSKTTTMTTGSQQDGDGDGVQDATRKMSRASLQTTKAGHASLDNADGDDKQMAKGLHDVILAAMEAMSLVQIPDFVPSLSVFYKGYLRYVRGVSLRFRTLILELVEKRLESRQKFIVGDSAVLDRGQPTALTAVGLNFENPDAMVDVVFDNLLSDETTAAAGAAATATAVAAKNLAASRSFKDGQEVAYGETEACLLLMSLLSAGTDTTTSVTVFLLMELLRHPKMMAKLKAEVDEAVEVAGDSQKFLSENDLENLPYLNAVLYETLRLHTPGPLFTHQAVEDAVVFGYDVPAGTQVLVNAWAIMHDPEVWPEPWEFRPERFIRDGRLADDLHPDGKNFAFIPFGSGRRVCPGMRFALNSVRFVVSRLAQRFDFTLPRGVQPEDLDFTERDGIVIFPENPVPIVFRPRSIGVAVHREALFCCRVGVTEYLRSLGAEAGQHKQRTDDDNDADNKSLASLESPQNGNRDDDDDDDENGDNGDNDDMNRWNLKIGNGDSDDDNESLASLGSPQNSECDDDDDDDDDYEDEDEDGENGDMNRWNQKTGDKERENHNADLGGRVEWDKKRSEDRGGGFNDSGYMSLKGSEQEGEDNSVEKARTRQGRRWDSRIPWC